MILLNEKRLNNFNIYCSIGKKTFKIIYQLSSFVGHPVYLSSKINVFVCTELCKVYIEEAEQDYYITTVG